MTTVTKPNYDSLLDFWSETSTSPFTVAAVVNYLTNQVWGKGYSKVKISFNFERGRTRAFNNRTITAQLITNNTETQVTFESNTYESQWQMVMLSLLWSYYAELPAGTVELTLTLQDNGDITPQYVGKDSAGTAIEPIYTPS